MGGGEMGKWVMAIEEGTCWDEHWVLYGNQFDNKFNILQKNNFEKGQSRRTHITILEDFYKAQ